MADIERIKSHKIINSRGNWTIMTEVWLDDDSYARQSVPNGASTGENEANCLPADKAVEVVNNTLAPLLRGKDAHNQGLIDQLMLEADGSNAKVNLGGNSILSVSLAVCHAAAKSNGVELYQYIRRLFNGEVVDRAKLVFPTPVFNILNGGKHAQNGLSFQEFMVIPVQGIPFDESIQIGMNVYKDLKDRLLKDGYSTGVGDEGGFAPEGFTAEKALSYIRDAVSQKYVIGKKVFLGMDVAAGSFYEDGTYIIPEEKLELSETKLVELYKKLAEKFELIYLEDGLYEKDYKGWDILMKKLGDRLMVVADDLVVTNPRILTTIIERNLANAVIVKPNQIGTLSETFDFIRAAKANNMSIIVSHRSGETAEDTFIADLALGVGADFIKSGALARGERVAKYNRLLEVFIS